MTKEQIIINQISQLELFQKEQLVIQLQGIINQNIEVKNIKYNVCPKCDIANPKVGPRGVTKAGKPMIECKHCNKRFVFDHGLYSFYSHSSQAEWNEVIKHTILLTSIKEVAAILNIHEQKVFSMRHKILFALEIIMKEVLLEMTTELDEKYIDFAHKGKKMKEIDRVIKTNGKRGVSNNTCCLITGVSRNGKVCASVNNMGAPK